MTSCRPYRKVYTMELLHLACRHKTEDTHLVYHCSLSHEEIALKRKSRRTDQVDEIGRKEATFTCISIHPYLINPLTLLGIKLKSAMAEKMNGRR